MVAHSARSAQLQSLLERHRVNRAGLLERDIPFLWSRCFVSIFSYALLLSDVLRSGLGIRNIQYSDVEPNQIMYFGPYAYPVAHIQHAQPAGTGTVWSYKFDSSGVAMRAYAEFFQLQTWPPCLFYRTQCTHETLELSTVFQMLDSLVEAMARRRTRSLPKHLTLRTRSAWVDRIYHFILPQFFQEWILRTNQALYYDAASLESPAFQLCSTNPIRPYACRDFWTHFTPICEESNPLCQGIGHVWQHILARKQSLQQQYSNMSLDMLVVESQDDFSKPGVSFQGRKLFDIAVIIRARDCSSTPAGHQSATNCSTIAVDEFRYEGASLLSDAIGWYHVVASFRAVGQVYAWARLLLLFLGCFYARSAEPRFARASLRTRVFVGLRTMFLVPSQMVIYGSIFPICCYVIAHLLDSAMVYQLVSLAFNTYLGAFTLHVSDFLRISAVSMRSVWVLALALHVLVAMRTGRNWSPMNGIPGIPEFTISFVSCLTIMAQFRSIAFRDTHVESISEVVQSSRVASIRASAYDNTRSFWGLLFFGNMVDAQCLFASASALCALVVFVWCVLRVLSKKKLTKRVELFFWPRTLIPYSGGTLWASNALVVSWNSLFVFTSADEQVGYDLRYSSFELANTSAFVDMKRARKRPKGVQVSPTFLLHDSKSSRFVQHEIAIFDERCREVESMIYLMNLAVMTDPIVLLRLCWLGGKNVGIYKSKATGRLFFIPQAVMKSHQNTSLWMENYKLLFVVSTKELPWLDLLQCG